MTEAARNDGRALLRSAARLYASMWTEASPSRLRLFDLESGALDAAPPDPMTVRHRSFVPEGETEALRLSWPADGADGAAVVRYADAALPPDVVFFAAGDRRTIPLSGVARIDFLVAGSDAGVREVKAPVEFVRESGSPFGRLEARAEASSFGPRLIWSTGSHAGLRGWAIFREEIGRGRPDPADRARSRALIRDVLGLVRLRVRRHVGGRGDLLSLHGLGGHGGRPADASLRGDARHADASRGPGRTATSSRGRARGAGGEPSRAAGSGAGRSRAAPFTIFLWSKAKRSFASSRGENQRASAASSPPRRRSRNGPAS